MKIISTADHAVTLWCPYRPVVSDCWVNILCTLPKPSDVAHHLHQKHLWPGGLYVLCIHHVHLLMSRSSSISRLFHSNEDIPILSSALPFPTQTLVEPPFLCLGLAFYLFHLSTNTTELLGFILAWITGLCHALLPLYPPNMTIWLLTNSSSRSFAWLLFANFVLWWLLRISWKLTSTDLCFPWYHIAVLLDWEALVFAYSDRMFVNDTYLTKIWSCSCNNWQWISPALSWKEDSICVHN